MIYLGLKIILLIKISFVQLTIANVVDSVDNHLSLSCLQVVLAAESCLLSQVVGNGQGLTDLGAIHLKHWQLTSRNLYQLSKKIIKTLGYCKKWKLVLILAFIVCHSSWVTLLSSKSMPPCAMMILASSPLPRELK